MLNHPFPDSSSWIHSCLSDLALRALACAVEPDFPDDSDAYYFPIARFNDDRDRTKEQVIAKLREAVESELLKDDPTEYTGH